ncbi:MAG: sulfur transferase domain-containing protein [Myxococcota bacterium]
MRSRGTIIRSGLAILGASLLVGACAAATPVAEAPPGGPRSLRLPNERSPSPSLLTGGQPTPTQLEAAKAAGFATVINLRPPGEPGSWDETELVESLGLRYVSIPIAGAVSLTRANARLLAHALAKSTGPVVLHCASGNRVGALLALKAALLDGVDAERAVALGLDAGMTSLEGEVRKILGLP